MSEELVIMILGFVFIQWRLDRLGKQLEAVCANIKAELAPTEERGNEIIREWKELKDQQSKDQRKSFIFWAVVIVAAIAWWFIQHPKS